MKKNILKTIACGALILATTGCKEEKAADVPQQQASPRDALVKALETQASGLVLSFNNVIADSQFIKNLELNHPPEKISMETESDVKKAVGYLLSSEKNENGATVYTPDARICSEVLAKSHPETCQDVFSKIKLAQVEQDSSSGYVEVYMSNIKAFGFIYTPELVSVSLDLPALLSALAKVDEVNMAHNEESMNLPSIAQGNAAITVAQSMGATIADITINQKIHVVGVNGDGQNYDVAIEAGQNVITASFFPSMSLASLSVNLPQALAVIPAHDHDDMYHALELSFPGGSGIATLNNAMSMIEFAEVKLANSTVTAKADGQAMAQLTVNGQVDAQVTSYQGGHLSVKFLSAISGQLQTVSNPMFSEQGTISASIAQGTEAYFAKDANQGKLLSGSFSFVGTQDFLANMNATAGMCIAADDNKALYLETVACQ